MAALLTLLVCPGHAQKMHNIPGSVPVNHIQADFPVSELDNKAWKRASEVKVGTYWSGERAPAGRHFKARLLWSDAALYVRFEAAQTEPLVVSENPDLSRKTMNLWDRDVCEIFIAPDSETPNKYYEFEVAPTGEWLDLKIHALPGKRQTDWDYRSGMESAARTEKGKIVTAIKIGWAAFGKTPAAGDVWRGNLFRCVGGVEARGYLAWRPTYTAMPNFHVPERFGQFVFEK